MGLLSSLFTRILDNDPDKKLSKVVEEPKPGVEEFSDWFEKLFYKTLEFGECSNPSIGCAYQFDRYQLVFRVRGIEVTLKAVSGWGHKEVKMFVKYFNESYEETNPLLSLWANGGDVNNVQSSYVAEAYDLTQELLKEFEKACERLEEAERNKQAVRDYKEGKRKQKSNRLIQHMLEEIRGE